MKIFQLGQYVKVKDQSPFPANKLTIVGGEVSLDGKISSVKVRDFKGVEFYLYSSILEPWA